MDGCLFFICMPYPCSLKVNQHQGSCTLRSSHMILLPCRLAGSKPKQLTRPYVVEKREAGLERYGTARHGHRRFSVLHCHVCLLTRPTRVTQCSNICAVCLCVYIYICFSGWSQSLCFLSLSLSTGCRPLRSHSLFTQDDSLCIWVQTTKKKKKSLLWCVWAVSKSFWKWLWQFLLCGLHSWSQVLDHKWLVLNTGKSIPDGFVIQMHCIWSENGPMELLEHSFQCQMILGRSLWF